MKKVARRRDDVAKDLLDGSLLDHAQGRHDLLDALRIILEMFGRRHKLDDRLPVIVRLETATPSHLTGH